MNRFVQMCMLVAGAVLALAVPAMAQDGGASISFSPSFGAGIIILGAGFGIAKIGAAAVESMARQPEVAGNIQTAMIIAAALIEGVALFGLVICILLAIK